MAFYYVSLYRKGKVGHFIVFCLLERHTSGHFGGFCPLEGHIRAHNHVLPAKKACQREFLGDCASEGTLLHFFCWMGTP